jgi:hypothetical protein
LLLWASRYLASAVFGVQQFETIRHLENESPRLRRRQPGRRAIVGDANHFTKTNDFSECPVVIQGMTRGIFSRRVR